MNERKNTSYILLLAAFMLSFLTIYEVEKANGANKDKKGEIKTQLKKVSKVKTTKTLPKKKVSKKPIQKQVSSRDLSEFIKKKLLVFEGIQFQSNGECPDSFSEEEVYAYEDINQNCRSPVTDLGPAFHLFTEQSFFNGRIVEYSYHLEAMEPIRILFHGPEELESINLMIDGGSVFGIIFEDNLVSSFYKNNEDMLELKNRIKYYEKDDISPRLKVLLTGKKKVESILNDLCIKTHHQKTCKAHKELRGFEYPLPPKLLATLIQP